MYCKAPMAVTGRRGFGRRPSLTMARCYTLSHGSSLHLTRYLTTPDTKHHSSEVSVCRPYAFNNDAVRPACQSVVYGGSMREKQMLYEAGCVQTVSLMGSGRLFNKVN